MKKYLIQKKANKFGAKKCPCKTLAHGLHNSIHEAGVCNDLYYNDEVERWTVEHPIPLIVNGLQIAIHRVDFYVFYKDGTKEFLEAKGKPTSTWRLKKKMVEAMHPDIPYRVVYADTRKNKPRKKPKV